MRVAVSVALCLAGEGGVCAMRGSEVFFFSRFAKLFISHQKNGHKSRGYSLR